MTFCSRPDVGSRVNDALSVSQILAHNFENVMVYFYWPPGPNPVVTISTRVGPGSRLLAPLRRTNNEDDDAQCILAECTYTTTSAPFLEICTSVLRLDVRFVVLALARSVAFRWKAV